MDYKKAGVDIEAGYRSVELMKEHVKKTMRPEVLGGLGGFSGAFSLAKIKEMEEPVLLSGTDGCGTKVKLAMILDKHDTIGIDAVAMCVNDIACAGGEPLFFLDYIACGKNEPEKIADIVKGVAEGCLQAGAALIGGETAEHPGLMAPEEYGLAVSKGTLAKLKVFAEIVGGFIGQVEKMDAAFMLQHIIHESGMMKDIYQDSSPEGMSRQENVQELLNGVQEFVAGRLEAGQDASLGEFLQEVSLLSDLDEDDGDDSRKVTLMTIHSAKGLEFPAVFIVGMEENLFPSPRSSNSPMELEEERRLFYVAITRAEQFCFLSFARSRFRYGQTEFSNPSRFLQDIDPKYVVMDQGNGRLAGASSRARFSDDSRRGASERFGRSLWESREEPFTSVASVTAKVTGLKPLGRVSRISAAGTQGSSEQASSTGASGALQAGMRIEHERFGLGVVKAVEGSGENAKATVEFKNTGTKQLLLRFARFKVVE